MKRNLNLFSVYFNGNVDLLDQYEECLCLHVSHFIVSGCDSHWSGLDSDLHCLSFCLDLVSV